MFFKILLNYIIGYVSLEIEGYYIERFINNCISKDIFLWGIKRTKSTILYANLSKSDFKETVKIAKKNSCKIKIKKKHGFPFTIKKYKKRKILIILLLIILISIYTLSKFVWNIEIIGNEKINLNEIIQMLEKDGLKIGTLKNKIDTENIINKIRYDRNDIAWIGIEVIGTNVKVQIVEADEKPEVIDESDYCNIIAIKDSKIKKISAQNGTLMVKEGDEVKKGDILIAGWMEGKYTDKYYVNANGNVSGIVKYSNTEKIYKKSIERVQTGNCDNSYSIKFNNFKINLYKTLSKFENYDTMYMEKKIKLFSNFYLPIEVIKNTNYEVVENEISYNKEQAKIEGEKIADEKMKEKLEEEVLNKSTTITEYDTYYEVKVTYEIIEEVGTKEKIVF